MSKTRMGKRVASLLLSLVMMLSLLPTTVYAEGADTGDTTDEIVGQATTSGDNTEGTGEPEPTGEDEGGSANVTEGEDGAATNDAVVEETIAPVNAEGVDAVANAESNGDEVSGEDGNELVNFVTVNGDATEYETLEKAIEAADPDADGVITYNISGKVSVTATGWIQVAKAGLTDLTAVKFVGKTVDAGICINGGLAILADQNYDIDVSFEALTLSKQYPTYGGDYGHSTNYFTTWLRNSNAAENTVTYTNCTFPNGVSNNQYGKTVFDNCKFTNGATGLYNLWVYGGNVELNGGTFTGTRGAKVYTEGTPETVPAVTIKDTSFDGLTEKAAIVVSKPVNVEVSNVDVTGEKGFFTRDITGNDEVQLTVAGTGISGTFKITSATDAGAAKDEFNISAGTFTSEVPNDYCADGFEVKANADGTTYGVEKAATAAAQIGETTYETLQAAIAAAEAGQTVTLLADATEDVIINKNITLDLGGKTLTNTNAGKATISVTGGTVTVKNGTVIGGTSYYNIEVTKDSNANLTLEGVTATAGNNGSSMIDNWGTLTIESGDYSGGMNTVKSEEGSTLTINGGTFTCDFGKKWSYTAVILVYGDTTINGGKFIQKTTNTSSYAKVVMTGKEDGYEATTKVTGGEFNNEKLSGIFWALGKATSDNFEVSGGTFNKSVSDSFFKEGYFAKKTADGYTAVGPYAVRIGTTGYGTLKAAIEAMNSGAVTGTTITLLQDVTESVVISKKTTIDLNGKTLTNNGAANTIQVNGGMLTVKDGKSGKNPAVDSSTKAVTYTSGKIVNDQPRSAKCVAVKVNAGASFVLTNGTLESQHNYALNVTGENANATVSGGYIVGQEGAIGVFDKAKLTVKNGVMDGTDNAAIAGNGNAGNGDTTITISGGTIIGRIESAGYIACGIYHPQFGTLNISGGTIYAVGGVGILMRAGVLNMTGGKIVSSGEKAGKVGDANVITTCYGVYVDGSANYPGAQGTEFGAKISGTANIAADAGIPVLNLSNSDTTNGTIGVSGGTFTSAVPAEYCAEGFIPVKNADGSYGVREANYVAQVLDKNGNPVGGKYESLQAAIDAAKRNDTVKMLADTRENVTINNAMTLDLNGHTLNGGTVKGTPTLKIDTARVTVMDSSEAKTGTIMREDTAENSGVSSHYVIDIQGRNALLTFNSGNVRNNSGNTEGKGASLVRVGDDSNMEVTPFLTITGGTFTQNNFIAIKVDRGILNLSGGEVNSANSYAVENWCNANIKGGTVNGTVSTWVYSKGSETSKLTISGGTVNGNVASVNYDSATDKQARVFIEDGEVTGTLGTYTYSNGLVATDDTSMATIKVSGGTFSSPVDKRYCDEGYVPVENDDNTYGVQKQVLAKIGDTAYYTMDEAFHAVREGETIVMQRDYTTGAEQYSGNKSFAIDLNDKTWTYTGTNTNHAAFEINYSDVTLTVKNGTVVSGTMVGLIPSVEGGTAYDNSGLVFEKVTMTANGYSGIETNGNNTSDAVTLKDSTLNVPNGFGIYFPSSGTLTIDNSTITAKTMGVQVCAGSLSISGDQTAITVSGDAVPKTENDGAIQDGAAISIVNRPGYKGLGDVTVTGGTFKANGTNVAIKAYDWANNTESDWADAAEYVNISGGTFSSIPDNMDGLCKDGFVPVKNADGYAVQTGTYVASIGTKKFATLAEAVEAAKDGDAVKLLGDVVLAETLIIKDKTITLDLNGRTISNSAYIWDESKYAWSLISVRDNGDLTINDTTGGGTLKAKENDCFALDVQDGGNLTVNGDASYVGNIHAIYVQKGTATVNGGSYSVQQKYPDAAKADEFVLNCYDANRANGTAKIIVNGGTFTNFDPRNNKAEGAGTSFVAEGVGVNNENGTFTAVPKMVAQIIAADGSSVKAYDSLAAAIAAAQDGQTVKLLCNVTENVTIAAAKKNLTLDLNGKTLNGGTEKGKAALTNHGTITIKDSSEGKTGTIKRDDNSTAGYYVIRNQGKMTIESGTVTNNSGYAKANSTGSMVGSSLICNGDCNEGGTLTIQGGTFTQDNFIAIKNGALGVLHVTGGTITSNHSAIQNWFKADITGGEIKGQLWTDAYKEGESVGETKIGGNAKFTGEIVMDIYGSVAPKLAITGGNLEVTNWWITTTAANAGAKPAVSGGTFSSKVPAEYCAVGYIPANNGDGTYTVKEGKYVIEVTSRIQDTNQTVATPTGGGQADYGEAVTVSTNAVVGFKFLGWYVGDAQVSSDLSYTFTVNGDCKLVAVYQPVSGGTAKLMVNASRFTITGKSATQISYQTYTRQVGSEITVKFTDTNFKFLYWVNGSEKVVSTSEEYTFTLSSNTTLSAVAAQSEGSTALVVFMSAYNQVMSAETCSTEDTIEFPVGPSKMGNIFVGWSMTEAQIKEAMAKQSYIVVEPVYEATGEKYTITVQYEGVNKGAETYELAAGVSKLITAEATVDGNSFQYWKDANGAILSYRTSITVINTSDVTVTAVYGENETQKAAVVKVTGVTGTEGNSKYTLSFSMNYALLDGQELVSAGFVATKDANKAESLDIDNYTVKRTTTLTTSEGNYTLAVNVGGSGTMIYCKAFLQYKDANGVMQTLYSDVISASYDSLSMKGE